MLERIVGKFLGQEAANVYKTDKPIIYGKYILKEGLFIIVYKNRKKTIFGKDKTIFLIYVLESLNALTKIQMQSVNKNL